MKYALVLISSIGLFTESCLKSQSLIHEDAKTAPLVTSWTLVMDSTGHVGPGVSHPSYTGTSADYWDFGNEGILRIKEGSKSDTLDYTFLTDSTLSIYNTIADTSGYIGSYQIKSLSQTEAILALVPPVGAIGIAYFRTVYLSRQ